jgi:hypothetical protein
MPPTHTQPYGIYHIFIHVNEKEGRTVGRGGQEGPGRQEPAAAASRSPTCACERDAVPYSRVSASAGAGLPDGVPCSSPYGLAAQPTSCGAQET